MPIRGMSAPARNVPPRADPEAEQLGDRGDVGVGETLVLEPRHRHGVGDVARHAEAGDQEQDRGRHRPDRRQQVADRAPDRVEEAGPRRMGDEVRIRLGRETRRRPCRPASGRPCRDRRRASRSCRPGPGRPRPAARLPMRQPISVHEDSNACFSGGRTLVMRQPSMTRSSVAPANPSATEKAMVQPSQWAGSPKAMRPASPSRRVAPRRSSRGASREGGRAEADRSGRGTAPRGT